jgi:hypothetical protein
MIVLSVTVPFQTFIEGLLRSPFVQFLADPQSPYRGLRPTFLVVKAADPTRTRGICAVAAECGMHLIDEEQCEMPVVFIACLAIKPKEIAHCEGVGPQIAYGRGLSR